MCPGRFPQEHTAWLEPDPREFLSVTIKIYEPITAMSH